MDLDALEALAKAVESPQSWGDDLSVMDWTAMCPEDFPFAVAANPAAVLALIARIRELEATAQDYFDAYTHLLRREG